MKPLLGLGVMTVAVVLLALGIIGMLSSQDIAGFLLAGYVLLGGGIALLPPAWRLFHGGAGPWRPEAGRTPDERRLAARERVRHGWRVAAQYLLVLTLAYLVLAVVLEAGHAALGAAAVAALSAAGLGLLSWGYGRGDRRAPS